MENDILVKNGQIGMTATREPTEIDSDLFASGGNRTMPDGCAQDRNCADFSKEVGRGGSPVQEINRVRPRIEQNQSAGFVGIFIPV